MITLDTTVWTYTPDTPIAEGREVTFGEVVREYGDNRVLIDSVAAAVDGPGRDSWPVPATKTLRMTLLVNDRHVRVVIIRDPGRRLMALLGQANHDRHLPAQPTLAEVAAVLTGGPITATAVLLGDSTPVYTWGNQGEAFYEGRETSLGDVLAQHADRRVHISFDPATTTEPTFDWLLPNMPLLRLHIGLVEAPSPDQADTHVVVLIKDRMQVLERRIRALIAGAVLDETPTLRELVDQIEHGPGLFYASHGGVDGVFISRHLDPDQIEQTAGMFPTPPRLPEWTDRWRVSARYAGQRTAKESFHTQAEAVTAAVEGFHAAGYHHVVIQHWIGEMFSGGFEVTDFQTRAPRVGDRIIGYIDGRRHAGLITVATRDYGRPAYRIISGDPAQHTDNLVAFVEFDTAAVPGVDYDPAALDLRKPTAGVEA